ncbi:hypothetical protein BaRGS_00005931 [Batillaria attramentaria]|uniref:Uncharacterized protein n=1 Tax=Batillaria attramentaria TaxID=370345 RepID=A0ABD0LUD9_9CAEN
MCSQVAKFADETAQLHLLFDTEWLIVVTDENFHEVESVAGKFENVAVVVFLKGYLGHAWSLSICPPEWWDGTLDTPETKGRNSLEYRGITAAPQTMFTHSQRPSAKSFGSYMLFSSDTQGTKVYQGVLMDMLNELSTRVNFSYTVIGSADTSYGVKLDNGQWDGLIGMLTRKEADIALAILRLTTERAAVADPTIPFSYENAWLVARKPEPFRDSWRFFLHPYQAGVYLAVGACLVGALVFLLTLEVCQYWWLGTRQGAPFGKPAVFLWLLTDLEVLLTGVLNKPIVRESPSRAGRVLVCSWLLLGVVLVSVYSSKLTATLAVTDQALPFSSMAELVSQDTYTWGIRAGTALDSILKASTIDVFQKYYQGTLNFARSDPSVRDHSIEVQKAMVLEDNHAFLMASSYTHTAWNAECNDVVVTWPLGIEKHEVLYLQKGSPFTRLISEKLDQIVNAGLVTHWKRKWTPAKPPHCNQDGGQASRTIQLTEVQTAFYLAGAGVGLAVLTLGMECVVSRSRCFTA